MASLLDSFLLCLCLASFSQGAQPRRQPPVPQKPPIETVALQPDFDPEQFAGTWFLVATASRCAYLSENHYRLEATNVVVTLVPNADSGEKALLFSTFRPLEGHCWNITQTYFPGKTRGRFQIKGRSLPVEVAIGETDYSSYAVLFLQRAKGLSAKLYGRSAKVGPAVTAKFERRVRDLGLDENDHIFYFPSYGFCHTADSFHTLDETKFTGTR
nr:complement component C8 gamma chain [Anolis sagrei ordinatus]